MRPDLLSIRRISARVAIPAQQIAFIYDKPHQCPPSLLLRIQSAATALDLPGPASVEIESARREPLSVNDQHRLRQCLERIGERRLCQQLGIDRRAVARCAAGLDVPARTRRMLREGLRRFTESEGST
jgi:hypothetical protein